MKYTYCIKIKVKYTKTKQKIREPGRVLHGLFSILHRLSVNIDLGKEFPGITRITTECPKIYRKSVQHLLEYTANLYLSRYSTDLRYIFGHSVVQFYSTKHYGYTSSDWKVTNQKLIDFASERIGNLPHACCVCKKA